ncbi:MAG: DUF5683 domain-containing protein [Gracilimonas sp.]
MTRSISLALLLGLLLFNEGLSQKPNSYQTFVSQKYSLKKAFQDSNNSSTQYPDPKLVLRQSLMIPGWGQITNKQSWKVPIVYGLLGGLTYYSITLHKQYHDYRAAYYNLHPETPDDFKFGPTPDYIPESSNINLLKENRNFYRNRRDLVYVFIGLSYALNAIDAYVFAHLRPFDVSDDLSMIAKLQPGILATRLSDPIPSLSLSIKF